MMCEEKAKKERSKRQLALTRKKLLHAATLLEEASLCLELLQASLEKEPDYKHKDVIVGIARSLRETCGRESLALSRLVKPVNALELQILKEPRLSLVKNNAT
jgi:hypothetical protein